MDEKRVSFDQRKFILNIYKKFENDVDVQRQLKRVVHLLPFSKTVRVRDMFEAD